MKIKIAVLFCLVAAVGFTQPPAGADSKDIYTLVEEMAEFPGGITAMQQFLRSNISFPAEAREAGISGKCFLKFIVSYEGKITDVEVLKGVPGCKECDNEAVRVVKSMPDWKPGRMNGRPVNVYYNLPISFKMANPQPASPSPLEKTLTPEEQAKHEEAMKYYYQGHKLDQEGKYKKALEKFDASLGIEADNKYAMFDKAKMLLALGDKTEACGIWNKMVRLQLRKEEAEEFIKKNCN